MPISRRRLVIAALFACALIAGPSPLSGAAQARSAAPTLRVFVTGNGTVRGSGVECGAQGTMCGVTYALGTTITIQAYPAQFSVFAGWTGACTGAGNVCTLTAGDPTTVTATFSYIEVADVNKTGDGQGLVVSDPDGISCGSVCSAPYSGNTRITLQAHPVAGSVFVGWTGACKGTGPCVLQQTYGTMAVWAQFEPKGKKGGSAFTTPDKTGGGSGTTIHTKSSGPLTASSLGASVQKTATGHLITVKFQVSKAASVKLEIWSWKKHLISRAKLAVQAGPVTIKLPFSGGYMNGDYDLWGYVTGTGEKKYRMLHWKVHVT